MESEIELKHKRTGNYDVVVEMQAPGSNETSSKPAEFQGNGSSQSMEAFSNVELSRVHMNLFTSNPTPAQLFVPSPSPARTPAPDPSPKPPVGPAIRRRTSTTRSAYCKPKSRIVEPPYPSSSKPVEEIAQIAPAKSPYRNSPNMASPLRGAAGTPRSSAPITPRTPLMASTSDGGDDDEDEDDEEGVYNPENLNLGRGRRGKKVKVMVIIEWFVFLSVMTVLTLSLTVHKLLDCLIWGLELWKWCVLVLVIFCGHLFTDWLIELVVFLIEKNFLLKKKVLYFVFGLKKSVRIVIWLSLILMAWALLIDREVRRSEYTSRVLSHITRGIISSLVGAVMWMMKTLLVKLVASHFHVRTYFDRIQESIFHQYILQALSGNLIVGNADESDNNSKRLSFNRGMKGKQEMSGEVVNVDKLYKMKREKVSAWTMGGLINVIRSSGLPTISEVLDESVEGESGEPKVIMNEVEARHAANRIFKNVAKPGHKYIEEDDLLRYMPKEEVDNAIPLFEGAAESKRIKKSAFRNWVGFSHGRLTLLENRVHAFLNQHSHIAFKFFEFSVHPRRYHRRTDRSDTN